LASTNTVGSQPKRIRLPVRSSPILGSAMFRDDPINGIRKAPRATSIRAVFSWFIPVFIIKINMVFIQINDRQLLDENRI